MRGPGAYVVGRALEALFTRALARYGELPIPHDTPLVHTVGPDADRLLLMGTGTVRGLGVTSYELGLGGQLARRLSPLTGRGVDLELASETTLMIHQAAALVDSYDTSRFDAIILVMGIRDTVSMTSPADWRRDMRHLLQAVSRVPQVFLVAIPDFTTYTDLPPFAKRVIRRQAARLNDESRHLAEVIPGVQYVPVNPGDPGHFVQPGSIEVYEIFADAIAPAIAQALDPLLHGLRPADLLPQQSQQARQEALDALGVIGTGEDPDVDRITRMARDLLGASGASVTFLDHDRQWVKSAVSVSTDDMPRVDAFCNTTVEKSRLFVVEDASKDARFASHPWVVGDEQVKFYAGYPLEAPGGVRIGALCVVDTKPRCFSDAEAALLRDLALRVQALLWSAAKARHQA
ncbi:MAG TPA: GAF domain-containing protein [Pseudolysinimonas sp.]|nr:GAF domain-containing protein [Pseudolysinimonas sp.]